MPLNYYEKVIIELEKNTRNLTVFMVLIISPSSTLKFLFVFGFNHCLWATFSLNLENFWFIFGLRLYDFLFHNTDDFTWPQLECKEHQIYSKTLRMICKKEV